MLAQLSTVKARLALDPIDLTFDALLLRAIEAVSARFDLETNRTLARSVDFQQEFNTRDTELIPVCYPIEVVSKFELKSSETDAWVEQANVAYLIRGNCVLSLNSAFRVPQSALCTVRVTYTGGYVLPGDPVPQPSTAGRQPVRLPADLEQAAVEQTTFWFQTRGKLGLLRQWPQGGGYEQFAETDLLPAVRAILKRHTRLVL